MNKFLLVTLLLLPIFGFTQTSYDLPDGTRMQAYLAIPNDFVGGGAPLAIIMGGGSGDDRIASRTFESLGQELVARGWAVATPVSPNGQSFFAENGEKVRQLITLIKARGDIADGSVLLGGISNGGISSLQIASSHPDEYLGVVKGVRRISELDLEPLVAKNLLFQPVAIWVGNSLVDKRTLGMAPVAP